jgi:iron complex transport system permease protein
VTAPAPAIPAPPVTSAVPADRFRGGAARRVALLLLAGLAVLAVALLGLAVGSRPLPLADVVRALHAPDGSDASVIVRELRLPRTVVGLVVGAALGLAGAAVQGLTRNPLADPGLLGVSAGAAFGVVVGITAGVAGTATGNALCATAGALAAAVVVGALAGGARSSSPLPLLLSGVALTALLSSLTTVLVLLDATTLDQFRFWVVGSVAGRDLALLLGVVPLLAAGALLVLAGARGLDALALGDDLARGLGIRVGRARLGAALGATLLTAGSVAVAGPLGFVGLVVPHVGRALVGPAHRWLLPLSALLGAALLVGADVVGRVVARPAELQVGIVTALVGAPVLVLLVQRRRVLAA